MGGHTGRATTGRPQYTRRVWYPVSALSPALAHAAFSFAVASDGEAIGYIHPTQDCW